MSVWRKLVLGLSLVVGLGVCSTVSFADPEAHEGHHADTIKLLRDSAAALQATHPDLAEGLTKLADHESKEMEEWKAHKQQKAEKSKEQAKEKNQAKDEDRKAHHEAHVKLLRDSAAALQATHPDLADGLTKMADRKAKWSEHSHEHKAKDAQQ